MTQKKTEKIECDITRNLLEITKIKFRMDANKGLSPSSRSSIIDILRNVPPANLDAACLAIKHLLKSLKNISK